MSSLAAIMQRCGEAVAAAVPVCRAVQRDLALIRAITKGDASPVTIADYAAQAIVCNALRDLFTETPLVAEEHSGFLRDPAHAPHLQSAVEHARIAWRGVSTEDFLSAIDLATPDHSTVRDTYYTLDPIDGTKGFIAGRHYAICLALIQYGRPVVAAMACPNLGPRGAAIPERNDPNGTVYVAAQGEGVWEWSGREFNHRPRLVRQVRTEGEFVAGLPIEFGGNLAIRTNDIIRRLGAGPSVIQHPAVSMDSQAKYALLARGDIDLYLKVPGPRGSKDNVWDHAPGLLLATEAGCRASDVDGRNLDLGAPPLIANGRGILAAPSWLADRVVTIVRAGVEGL
ncbi:MAG: inositol monophosphatase family protein [Phycisphaerales bacterium]|nr:inositol monophosphatase family protein [Phycisphaerales bacterium]